MYIRFEVRTILLVTKILVMPSLSQSKDNPVVKFEKSENLVHDQNLVHNLNIFLVKMKFHISTHAEIAFINSKQTNK